MLYALDTNVFVAALRDGNANENYKRVAKKLGPRLRLPAVVALELHAGARNPAQVAALNELLAAFTDRNRVIVPTASAFLEAGRVISQLASKERYTYAVAGRLFSNDVLIATSCRAEGATLITGHHDDFARVRRYLKGFRFLNVEDAATG